MAYPEQVTPESSAQERERYLLIERLKNDSVVKRMVFERAMQKLGLT